MHILTINCGSSSIKCAFFEGEKRIWQESLESLAELPGALPHQPEAAVHRLVHGGSRFQESVKITPEIKQELQELIPLAPLHLPLELEAIDLIEKAFPHILQVATFDTAFHHTLTPSAKIYPGPYSWYTQGLHRYGFHGLSFQYCSQKTAELFPKASKVLICHLGSGASLCAVQDGISIDTTMGFTPLDGLMMDTRSGAIDPGLVLHLAEQTTPEALSQTLYKESGLLGVSGISGDMRDILKSAFEGSARAELALDVYIHRLVSLIGAMVASLQGLDVLVFTAGIGEHAPRIRELACERLKYLGVLLDEGKNKEVQEGVISRLRSRVQVVVMHTQEDLQMVKEVYNVKL